MIGQCFPFVCCQEMPLVNTYGVSKDIYFFETEFSYNKNIFKNSKNIEISRFKGLGEMPPKQLRETTMSKINRKLIKIELPQRNLEEADKRRSVDRLVDTLMGRKADLRFDYIQNNAISIIDVIDV